MQEEVVPAVRSMTLGLTKISLRDTKPENDRRIETLYTNLYVLVLDPEGKQ